MQKKTFAILGTAIGIIVIGGLLMFYANDESTTRRNAEPRNVAIEEAVSSTAYSLGPDNAPIVLVEFGDFQCPACKAAEPELKKFLSQYPDAVKFYFRHFPLKQHSNALRAATASEAAGVQGKFWEMHDELYKNQNKLGDEDIREYAKAIGLDIPKFESDWASDAIKNKVQVDLRQAEKFQLTSTPTFILNGKIYSGVLSSLDLERLVKPLL